VAKQIAELSRRNKSHGGGYVFMNIFNSSGYRKTINYYTNISNSVPGESQKTGLFVLKTFWNMLHSIA
jgi:hypothetical protein